MAAAATHTADDGSSNSNTDKRSTPPSNAAISLLDVISGMLSMIFSPDPNSNLASYPLLLRIQTALNHNSPQLRIATARSGRSVLLWTRRGSPLRALLVISVGTVILFALTGLLIFLIVLLAATLNAVIISLLMALAATASFLAIFFVCVTTIYIGALTIAAVVISTVTVIAIVAAMILTGWIGLFWIVWLATKKSVDIARHSLGMSSSSVQSHIHSE